MKKLIIITIAMILILIIIGFLIYSSFIPRKTGKIIATEDDLENTDEEQTNEQTDETIEITDAGTGKPGAGVGGVTGQASSSGNGNSESENLPPDFYNAPCGNYYSEYGVCGGTCPLGSCKEIGKSCYCVLE